MARFLCAVFLLASASADQACNGDECPAQVDSLLQASKASNLQRENAVTPTLPSEETSKLLQAQGAGSNRQTRTHRKATDGKLEKGEFLPNININLTKVAEALQTPTEAPTEAPTTEAPTAAFLQQTDKGAATCPGTALTSTECETYSDPAYSRKWKGVNNWATVPYGCVTYGIGDDENDYYNVYFNTDQNGQPAGSYDWRIICWNA
jgi:hypothetical protein